MPRTSALNSRLAKAERELHRRVPDAPLPGVMAVRRIMAAATRYPEAFELAIDLGDAHAALGPAVFDLPDTKVKMERIAELLARFESEAA
jgi:hypothetical protein